MISIMLKAAPELPPPFDRVPPGILQHVRLSASEYLFHQGQASRAFYFVIAGKVSLVRHTEAGEKVTLYRAGTGDFVAEASLFSDVYHCDGVSETESHVVAFNGSQTLEHLQSDPGFALIFIEKLTKQIQIYRRRLELLAIRSAKERVWAGFCDGWLTDGISEFAGLLGLSREATYRALSELVRDGKLLRTGYGRYTVERPSTKFVRKPMVR